MSQRSAPYHRAGLLLLAMLTLYGILLVTHRGEFWPFAIDPLFSNPGRPWTRVLVRDISQDTATAHRWDATTIEALPGRPVPLNSLGLSQSNLLVFAAPTEGASNDRRAALDRLLAVPLPAGTQLMVYRVVGTLASSDNVAIRAIPLGLLTPDGFHLRPTDTD